MKPEEEAFSQVIDDFACAAARIAFFDDNPVNVDAAREFGCQAMLVRGIDELRSSMTSLGIRA